VGSKGRFSDADRREMRRLRRDGLTLREIAERFGCDIAWVFRVARGVDRCELQRNWPASRARLSLAEREEIGLGLERGETFTAIAARVGRSVSTVSREVAANGGRRRYRAWRSHDRAFARARRPKPHKLAHRPLAAQVTGWTRKFWSPQEIACRLRVEYPDDPMMWVSHETIYKSLYVQGRGELRRELARCLRSGRAQRRPQHRLERRGRIPNMVMISERPAEVADRAVPGHWEGDLIVGRNGRSQVGTLVERTTRFVLLMKLADGCAETLETAMRKAIRTLPAELFRTITWDQGSEMARHTNFTFATGIPIYFCDPHSPWQRGSNENTNGLLRQYMPKGTDLSPLSQRDLNRIARSLNDRPRATLGYMKPFEELAKLFALTP
jgi:IS30 family transposase